MGDDWGIDIVKGRQPFATGGPVSPGLSLTLDNPDGCFIPTHRDRLVTITAIVPNPWWRRLLRLKPKTVTRGPYRIEQWSPVKTEESSG